MSQIEKPKEWIYQRHAGGEPFVDTYLHPECMRLWMIVAHSPLEAIELARKI